MIWWDFTDILSILISTDNKYRVLISSYGVLLAQRASYLALHSSLFGALAQLIIITILVISLKTIRVRL